MENAISHDCRGVGGTELYLLCSNKEGRGAGSILRKGGSSQERTPGPCELYGGWNLSLFLLLVFLLNAIFLNHISKNLFYVFKFLFIAVQFAWIFSSARVSFRRDKDFPRQATYKGVQDHLTSPVRNFKRDSSSGGKKENKSNKD